MQFTIEQFNFNCIVSSLFDLSVNRVNFFRWYAGIDADWCDEKICIMSQNEGGKQMNSITPYNYEHVIGVCEFPNNIHLYW